MRIRTSAHTIVPVAALVAGAFACTTPADTGTKTVGTTAIDTSDTTIPPDTDPTEDSGSDAPLPIDETIYSHLFINEFMASNQSAYSADSETFPDWIELVNTGDTALDLAGVWLTDDLEDPEKAALPAGTTIEAGGFLVLHATGDEAPTGLALPFKLSADGEAIGLSTPSGVPLHRLTYGPQMADIAAALAVDGDRASGWVYHVHGTPGASNRSAE